MHIGNIDQCLAAVQDLDPDDNEEAIDAIYDECWRDDDTLKAIIAYARLGRAYVERELLAKSTGEAPAND